jgi:hypothetical protein
VPSAAPENILTECSPVCFLIHKEKSISTYCTLHFNIVKIVYFLLLRKTLKDKVPNLYLSLLPSGVGHLLIQENGYVGLELSINQQQTV